MTMIQASEVGVGMVVQTDDGPQKVTRVSNGFYRKSILIEWKGGWGCVPRSDLVEVL